VKDCRIRWDDWSVCFNFAAMGTRREVNPRPHVREPTHLHWRTLK